MCTSRDNGGSPVFAGGWALVHVHSGLRYTIVLLSSESYLLLGLLHQVGCFLIREMYERADI